jgi:ribosomal protein S18 acetylase RimI-like enzyme
MIESAPIVAERQFSRHQIMEFEATLKQAPQFQFEVTHNYARELFIPKDTVLTGKIHRHAHWNVVPKGKIRVITEEGEKLIEGPAVFMSKPGTKRIGYALEDTIWITIHPASEGHFDLGKIEEAVIAPDYQSLEDKQ